VPHLAQSSSPEQWASTAERLFDAKNFREAMHAFARAGLEGERAMAEAFHLRELAESKAANPRIKVADYLLAFNIAAQAFQRIAENENIKKDPARYYEYAARCFSKAKDDPSAAWCYEQAGLYTEAAKSNRVAGRFDDAVRVVKTYNNVEPSVTKSIVQVSALVYLNAGQIRYAWP
jgi:hypothetical protein